MESTKTVIEELSEAQATIAALTAERDALKAGSEKAATDHKAAVDALTVERDALKATVEAKDAEIVKAQEAHAAAMAAEVSAHAKTRDDLGVAKNALRNPAFAAAARLVLADATTEGAPAAQSKADGEPTTSEEAHKMYNAIDPKAGDGRAREAFRKKYGKLLGIA